MIIDKKKFLADQKWKADLLIGERINVPGESKAYDTERWKEEVDYTSPKKIPGEIKEIQPVIPGLEDLLAHHTGGGTGLDGFQDKPIDAILQDIITNEVISDEERARTLERILGPDYKNIINQFQQQQQQKNSLKIGNQQLAMNPADIPRGDGLINESMNSATKNLKEKYDMMLQNGFIDEVEYQKRMRQLFGTQKKRK